MGPKFFETRMGQKFYDGDVPRVVRALESIATSLDAIDQRQQTAPDDLRQLVREAVAIIDESDIPDGAVDAEAHVVDVRDWLKSARAALEGRP